LLDRWDKDRSCSRFRGGGYASAGQSEGGTAVVYHGYSFNVGELYLHLLGFNWRRIARASRASATTPCRYNRRVFQVEQDPAVGVVVYNTHTHTNTILVEVKVHIQ